MRHFLHCTTACKFRVITNSEHVHASSANGTGDSLCSASVLVVETGHDHLIWCSIHFHHDCVGVTDESKVTVPCL